MGRKNIKLNQINDIRIGSSNSSIQYHSLNKALLSFLVYLAFLEWCDQKILGFTLGLELNKEYISSMPVLNIQFGMEYKNKLRKNIFLFNMNK